MRVSIFKEASGQGYVTNKVELVSLACEDAGICTVYLFHQACNITEHCMGVPAINCYMFDSEKNFTS